MIEDAAVTIAKYLGVLTAGSLGVWGTAEGLGRTLPRVPNIWIALVLGVGFSVTANGMGFLPVPPLVPVGWSMAFAVVMGLISVGGAKQINDRMNPLKKDGPRARGTSWRG